MSEDKRRDLAFIEHILDSIDAIGNFLENTSKKDFCSTRLKQSAVVREIEIIGEAAKNISHGLKNKHPEISWKEITGTRDKMIHHYFGVDLDIVWDIAKSDLPKLKKHIETIKKEIYCNGFNK